MNVIGVEILWTKSNICRLSYKRQNTHRTRSKCMQSIVVGIVLPSPNKSYHAFLYSHTCTQHRLDSLHTSRRRHQPRFRYDNMTAIYFHARQRVQGRWNTEQTLLLRSFTILTLSTWRFSYSRNSSPASCNFNSVLRNNWGSGSSSARRFSNWRFTWIWNRLQAGICVQRSQGEQFTRLGRVRQNAKLLQQAIKSQNASYR